MYLKFHSRPFRCENLLMMATSDSNTELENK
jgi:hypothetical protein